LGNPNPGITHEPAFKYIDKAEPKGDTYSCARICVEMDLEKSLPEAIELQTSH
jgi:hypothetical protein